MPRLQARGRRSRPLFESADCREIPHRNRLPRAGKARNAASSSPSATSGGFSAAEPRGSVKSNVRLHPVLQRRQRWHPRFANDAGKGRDVGDAAIHKPLTDAKAHFDRELVFAAVATSARCSPLRRSVAAPTQCRRQKRGGQSAAPYFVLILCNQAKRTRTVSARRRRMPKPIAPNPSSIIAQVAGSGTALIAKLSVSKALSVARRRSDVSEAT